jgi:polyisoprenoid-binding protein YceI
MKPLLLLSAAVLAAMNLAACSKPAPQASADLLSAGFPAASPEGLPAGTYKLDPMHSSLTFQVDHMGFSHYTARFATFDAAMKLDPAHPEKAQIAAQVDPQSLTLNAPPAGFHDDLMGKVWLDAAAHPMINFVSQGVEKTGANTARVDGTLTLKGISKPVVLDVTFNGGYPGMDLDPHARIGFTATGHFNRSDFGMGFGVAPPNSHMGVSDDVEFVIDAEFTGPALKKGA